MAMTSDQFMSLVRGVMNIGGGVLVSHGIISGSGMAEASGMLIPLASLIWGWVVHDPVNVVAKADELKAKGVV